MIEIEHEVAERIALASMKDQLQYLESEVAAHENEGSWLHSDDYVESKARLIPAFKLLIKYYGG